MMIKKLSITFLLIISLAANNLFAQHIDGGTWVNAGISFEPIKDITVDLNEEARYNASIGSLNQLNTNISIDYKLSKKIKTGVEYRYSIRDNKNTNRFGWGISYKEGMGDFDLNLRTKFQYSPVLDGPEGTSWRNKLGLSYAINKDFSPFVSCEMFYSIANEISQFDNYRIEGGLDYGPNKHNDFTLSWIYDHEFNVNNPDIMHVLSFSYKYSF